MSDRCHRSVNFRSYEEARAQFKPEHKWSVFDGTRQDFNIASECVDRFDPTRMAGRVKYANGETSEFSFKRLASQSSHVANYLESHGYGKGDKIATLMEPSFQLYASIFGVLKRGAIWVPVSELFGSPAIIERLTDSDTSLLLTTTDFMDDVVPPEKDIQTITAGELFPGDSGAQYEPATSAEDPAFVQYTSGTTGSPTSTMMRHKSLIQIIPLMKFSIGLSTEDNYFTSFSPTWAAGIWPGTFGPLAFGNAFGTYSGPFEPAAFLRGLADFEITNIYTSPTLLRNLESKELKEYHLHLEKIATGGEKLDTPTRERITSVLDVSFADTYGFSEYGAIISNYNGFNGWERKEGSLGKPLPGVEVAVIDEDGSRCQPEELGEIAVRHRDEWKRSGDAGIVDEDGYFYHHGRIDDVIITAGYRIDPTEIEDVLLDYPEVEAAAVIGVPNDKRGEVVKSVIVPSEGRSDRLKDDIQSYVKERLSEHKYPRAIEFVDTLPRTASGKIKRQQIRERHRG